MMNLVIPGSVTVTGLPLRICSIHSGMTEPRLHMTFPYRVQQILVFPELLDLATATFSSIALVIPIAFIGYAALSVERQMTHSTPASIAAVSTLSVPMTFVRTASIGKNSQEGTCFSAAAWKI